MGILFNPLKDKFLTKNNAFLFEGVQYPFSNFYPSLIKEGQKGEDEVLIFISTEHYFMYQKAIFFKDNDVAKQLMLKNFLKTLKSEELDLINNIIKDNNQGNFKLNKEQLFIWKNIQNQIKKLGRKVRNFDANEWDKVKESKMKEGLYLKYTQNQHFKKLLLDTGEKYIGEAAFWDKEWGLGQNIQNCYLVPFERLGKNLLGKCLMEVRNLIFKENI